MGLTLIHGNSHPDAKPRVIVVAEPTIHAALSSDLALDVHPECFDYDTFVKASLSKSISTNNAVVVVSDSLSQRVAPLEAVIALVRSNIVLIPWKSNEEDIAQLNVAVASGHPTPNTLRRAIFNHVGMNELPPRFDGDNYIEEPPDGSVVNFSPQNTQATSGIQSDQIKQNEQESMAPKSASIARNQFASPLDLFTRPDPQIQTQPQQIQPPQAPQVQYPINDATTNADVQANIELEVNTPTPISSPVLPERATDIVQPVTNVIVNPISETVQTEPMIADSFETQAQVPQVADQIITPTVNEMIDQPVQTQAVTPVEAVIPVETVSPTPTVHPMPDQNLREFDEIIASAPEPIEIQEEVSNLESANTSTQLARADEPSFLPEFFEDISKQEDTLPEIKSAEVVGRDINSFWSDSPSVTIDINSYLNPSGANSEVAQTNVTKSDGGSHEVAFTAADVNGSQQMWTMFDPSQNEQSNASSLSEFPDGSDHRKAISLFEPLVLCVYSPKGGVGKTSISVNLAARLAYTTRLQVCIVDLDIAFGNVGTRLGLYNPTVRELLNEPHIDGESLARNLVYDRRSGLFALLAPLRPETGVSRKKFSPAAYKKIMSLLKERFDVVILDCPVELRDPLVSNFALTESQEVMIVVNNEQATLLDARRAIEAMCRPKDSQRLPGLGIDPQNVGLVVNQKVDNVGREVDDIKAILSGGESDHPSNYIDILSVIGDDRHLWVGNANMARTVATSGGNDVDQLLDDIWAQILPGEAGDNFEAQSGDDSNTSSFDDIFGSKPKSKKKKRFKFFKGES